MSEQVIKKKIFTWLDEVIIGQNFCPFAKSVRIKQQIRITLSGATSINHAVDVTLNECNALEVIENSQIDTILVVLTNGFGDFYNYLDLVEEVNFKAEKNGLLGIYQFASFHPNYLFDGESENSDSHYTNRAPFPIIHILKEASLTKVLSHYPNPEGIPERNIEHAASLGSDFFKQFL